MKSNRDEALRLFQQVRKAEIFGNAEFTQCPYCRGVVHRSEAVAVHYITRGKRATEVEPENVWAGHAWCNSLDQQESGQGKAHEAYRSWLIDKIGEWKVLWLENRSKVTVKHGRFFYDELIKDCKNKLKNF